MAECPHPIDIHVGKRVRHRRKVLGITQEKLGESLGLTFQQVQKYERGVNRISSSKLFELSRLLDVPVGYFFEELNGAANGALMHLAETLPDPFEGEKLSSRETRELMAAYWRLPNEKVRKHVLQLMRSLGEGDNS